EHVVRRVDLDHRKLAGVEAQALLSGTGALRIENARRGHGRIRPACGAEADLALANLDWRSGGVARLFRAPARRLYAGIMGIGLGHRRPLCQPLGDEARAQMEVPKRESAAARGSSARGCGRDSPVVASGVED